MNIMRKRLNIKRSARSFRNVRSCPTEALLHLILSFLVKEKYGSDVESGDEGSDTDSEEAESEDEDGEELTPAIDAAILRTLARIKRKDPEIYDARKDVFEGVGCNILPSLPTSSDRRLEEQRKTGEMRKAARAPKDKVRIYQWLSGSRESQE